MKVVFETLSNWAFFSMHALRLRFLTVAVFLFVLGNVQFIHFHKAFGFPAPYIFLSLLIIAFLWRRNFLLPGGIHYWSKLVLFGFFLVFSTIVTQAYAEGMQILVDVVLGYVLASLLTCNFNFLRFFISLHYIYSSLIVVFMLDELGYQFLNELSFLVTDNRSGGETTLLPRINIFFSNPNWLATFYFFNCSLLFYITRNAKFLFVGAVFIFILQSKTYIALMAFQLLFFQLKNNYIRVAALACGLYFCLTFLREPISFFILQLQETSSVVNRTLIFEFVKDTIKLFPTGVLSAGGEELKNFSGEDTVPSIVVVGKLLGVFGLCLLFAAAMSVGWRYGNLIPIMMLGAAFSQSFLSVSGVAAVLVMDLTISLRVGTDD